MIGDFIGLDVSGYVHLATTYKPTGILLVIKSIKLYDKNTRYQFKNDLKVIGSNKYNNIITFFGIFLHWRKYENNIRIYEFKLSWQDIKSN